MAGNMTRKVNVIVTDDLDGSAGAEAVQFSLDGQGYEIDLSLANQARLRTSLQPFIDSGRRTSQRKPARTRPSADLAPVRAWAAEHGLQIAERGRISADIMTKYNAAHEA
jgi:hypothetical protein